MVLLRVEVPKATAVMRKSEGCAGFQSVVIALVKRRDKRGGRYPKCLFDVGLPILHKFELLCVRSPSELARLGQSLIVDVRIAVLRELKQRVCGNRPHINEELIIHKQFVASSSRIGVGNDPERHWDVLVDMHLIDGFQRVDAREWLTSSSRKAMYFSVGAGWR